ncbi:MAG TPA: 6,7-dimethyl-8-ribityllumazine synthase [bacterium]|nr:6,7-dimethyl-8-ribityllumazine synthase [bacterium]HOX86584.1 6,7-dimethyl-8-ribityllumazine synthase [bacterium]HPG46610.1 6,7-dimethyl-8-ribityllumazine synthase [bacterium]HPM98334.1 6,7-dimethyl-8-ribityllumazine synthase [bacterium]
MPVIYEGQLSAAGKRFGIVVSRFNELICSKLLAGALDCLARHGADMQKIDIVWVPGSFEIPVAAKKMAASKKFDALICLGAVIRGATPHFEYISAEVTKGIAQVGLEYSLPISYGVITPDTLEQALERAGTKAGNKGWDAALGAIEMADLFSKIS